jgi:hypothetical protein
MKKMFKSFGLAVVMLAFTATAFGQTSATANAGARIISPLSIAVVNNMHFGTIMRGTASTILLTPAGARSVATGTATLSALAPVHSAASFTVTGEPLLTYAITLPTDGTVTITGPGPAMAINGFSSSPATTGALSAGGTETLTVGGTLSVAAGQTSGTYTGTFSVSVNYN